MAQRTIRTGFGTYRGKDGIWTFGLYGAEVDVHDDDIERFDRLNPAEPKVDVDEAGDGGDAGQTSGAREFPEGDPSVDWKGAELKAYATAHGFDIGSASKKSDIVSAIEAAAAAKQAEGEQPADGADGEQPPADDDSQE